MKAVLIAALAAATFASSALCQVTIPPHASVYNGLSRGYIFTSNTNFIINQLELPLDAMQAGDTASFVVQVNGVQVFYSAGTPGPAVPCSILVNNGDLVDVVGNWSPATPSTSSAHNSYGSSAPYATTILGVPHTLYRQGVQNDIGNPAWVQGTQWLYTTPTTTGSIGRVFMYVAPQNGTFVNFSSDVTTGPSPLTVNFTDQTYTSDPGGITAWAWDFDGDSVIDSTLQNPSFTYQTCGSFDVTLTTVDAGFGANTVTKTAYITTDTIDADFTSQVVGPLTVVFNDTSSAPATTWAWDLDGDSIVDSTVQSPAWVYTNTNPVNVSLTVTRLCSAPSTITKTIVPLQQITHNDAPNNGLSSGASVYFDVDVTNPTGMTIGSMDVAPSVANTAFTVEMFVRQGTYTGFEGTAEEWVSVGVGSSPGGASTATPSALVTFPNAIHLPAGLSGIKLWYVGVGPRYQTGSGLATVTNGDLSLTVGTSRGSTTADPWAGSNITPRWWSGTIYYDTHNVSGLAGIGSFGAGCAGTMGVPSISASGNPTLGSTLTLTVDNLALSNMIMCTGFSNTSSVFGPLPYDATPFGAPGCLLRVSTEAVLFVVGANNQATWNFVIPNNPAFSGQLFFNQALAGDPTANAFGAVASNATSMVIGN
ncbi:MAG: PKD domain-containing protein [Planctomycetes bacterium]|nr:PKD domain-containing protein [Planctomycetota bacterium]